MEQSKKYDQLKAKGPEAVLDPSEFFGRIEITGVPDGFPPLAIRERWVGVQVRCVNRVTSAEGPSGSLGPGFVVFQADAVSALAERDAEAAEWFRDRGYGRPGPSVFHFCEACAREVEPCLWDGEFQQLLAEATR